ncbi:mast cell protease 2-like [Eurosta solidaginis]|uniref:mast cell protease 2-like n=1 Tax=Eurosta solidaginis TaxID=178769 RepID=UPI0035315779
MNFCIQFALPFVVLSSLLTCTNSQLRIVKGNKVTNIESMPYVVSISFVIVGDYCAGSIVTERFVLTAAHCLKDYKKRYITVIAGVTDRRETGQRREVQKKFIPPSYKNNKRFMDIGMIKVRTPFELGPTVNTIPLCSTSTTLTPDTAMQISGWGKLGVL